MSSHVDGRDEIDRLGPWFHNLHLPDGRETCPDHFLGDFPRWKWRALARHLPEDLSGWTALDIGCNAGFYSFELAKRGARVTGIDIESHYLAQARWAAQRFGIAERIELRQMQVYELARVEQRWDLVLFMGVFYHLRYPLLALDIVSRLVERTLVFQTLTMPGLEVEPETRETRLEQRQQLLRRGWPKMAFVEHTLQGDRTNWWAPNHACVEAMLRSSGLRVCARPEHEIYLCEPDPDGPSSHWTWNRREFEAVFTGGGPSS